MDGKRGIYITSVEGTKKLIGEGKFRDDLFYRISVIQINLPPLRKRVDDIKELADNFINIFSKKLKKNIPVIEQTFYDKLCSYTFPGNTRELKNIIERIILLSDKSTLTASDLTFEITNRLDEYSISKPEKLEDVERNHILSVLKSVDNNKNEAADILGIGLTTLYRKLNDYKLTEE